jgi:hypothetical protein
MVQRVLMGEHPLSPGTGIYASKPGSDVVGLSPGNAAHYPLFALNSKGGRMANVLQAGTCTQGATVTHPAIGGGAIPLVIFHRAMSNGGFNPHEIARNLNTPTNATMIENLSRWRIIQSSTTFRIVVQARNVSDPITGATFRYTVLNLAIN